MGRAMGVMGLREPYARALAGGRVADFVSALT